MLRSVLSLAVLLSLVGVGGAQENAGLAAVDTASIQLKHKVVRNWNYKLPAESFQRVDTAFRFTRSLGADFPVKIDGTALLVDTDADGEFDVRAEGKEARLVLKGAKSRYAVRLVNRGGWMRAPGGAMTGKLAGTKITLIDQNNNGRYTDFGKDAMIVGRGKVASFLSKVVNIDGALLEITPSADGTSIGYRPFTGRTGTLSLAECETKAKVLAAVVKSLDGSYSFDMARAGKGMLVPVGDYQITWGELGLGKSRATIRPGRSAPLTVEAGGNTSTTWGGPVKAEFAYARQADKVNFSPDHIWYYGAKGEEYLGWTPLGKSPKIVIDDGKTGRQIAEAYFPGSC